MEQDPYWEAISSPAV